MNVRAQSYTIAPVNRRLDTWRGKYAKEADSARLAVFVQSERPTKSPKHSKWNNKASLQMMVYEIVDDRRSASVVVTFERKSIG